MIDGGNDCAQPKKSKLEDGTVVQWFSEVLDSDVDWKANENCLKKTAVNTTADASTAKENERRQKKKANKFSFYKHYVSNRVKGRKCLQLCESADLWECKEKWVDSVEKNQKRNEMDATGGISEENLEAMSCCDNNSAFEYSLDVQVVHEMEEKVKKLVESLKDKKRDVYGNGVSVAKQRNTTIKFGSSNKLKCFLKNVFRTNRNEFDLRALDDDHRSKHDDETVHTWHKWSRCLHNVVRRRERFNEVETAVACNTSEFLPEAMTAILYDRVQDLREKRAVLLL